MLNENQFLIIRQDENRQGVNFELVEDVFIYRHGQQWLWCRTPITKTVAHFVSNHKLETAQAPRIQMVVLLEFLGMKMNELKTKFGDQK